MLKPIGNHIRVFTKSWRWPWTPHKVFLSSTSQDLESWRNIIAVSLRKAGLKVVVMDEFPAMSKSAESGSERIVRRCDGLFGIYARRYGTLAQDGFSITEHEYDAARDEKIATVCFFLLEDAEWPDEWIETEPGATSLKRFKDKIAKDVIVAWFSDLPELRKAVDAAVVEFIDKETKKRWKQFLLAMLMLLLFVFMSTTAILVSGARPELIAERDLAVPVDTSFSSLAIDPVDGQIITGDDKGRMLAYTGIDMVTREVGNLNAPVKGILFQSSKIVVAIAGGKIAAINVSNDKQLWSIEQTADFSSVASSSTGIAVGDIEGNTLLLDQAGNVVKRLSPASYKTSLTSANFGRLISVGFSPSGYQLALAWINGAAAIYDLKSDKFTSIADPNALKTNQSIAFADETVIVRAYQFKITSDGKVRTANALCVYRIAHSCEAFGISDNIFWKIKPLFNGKLLLTINWDGELALWDLGSRYKIAYKEVFNTEDSPNGFLLDVDHFRESRLFAVTGNKLLSWQLQWRSYGDLSSNWFARVQLYF